MAARNGHIEVATYLIERCRADIEQVGSGREIMEFTPKFHRIYSILVFKNFEHNTRCIEYRFYIIRPIIDTQLVPPHPRPLY